MSLPGLRYVGLLAAVTFCPLVLRAESTRTLRKEFPNAVSRPVAVENLVGTMRVTKGAGDAVVVVATVHAEDDALASSVRLEEVRGDDGLPTLRVRYPTAPRVLRYRRTDDDDDGWDGFGMFGDRNSERYDGHRYRVSSRRGTLLYADVEVRLPAHAPRATFRELIGELIAEGLEGKLSFRVNSADVRLSQLRGDVDVTGSSGDTRASRLSGTWRSEFSSGDCRLEEFEGSSVAFHTSSGDVDARDVVADRLSVETSSGDARIQDADVRELQSHASSGDLSFESSGRRLARVRAESSSGDVHLGLAFDSSFHADADQSSGEMRVRFDDGERKYRRGDLVSFRRGTGGTDIAVTTSSGDFTIDPR
jgi:hypothetical protein